MSIKSFFGKKSDYLTSIGFLGICLILDNKVSFSTLDIKEHEAQYVYNNLLKWPYHYIIDNVKYNGKILNSNKHRTVVANIPDTETGLLFKTINLNTSHALIIGSFSELISINDANEQLESLIEQALQKKILI